MHKLRVHSQRIGWHFLFPFEHITMFIVKLHRAFMAAWAAAFYSIKFFNALVRGLENVCSLLKSRSLGFPLSLLSSSGAKNLLKHIKLTSFDFTEGRRMHAFVSSISMIFAGPCHVGVRFFAIGEKSLYQTKSTISKLWGNASLSKLSLYFPPVLLAMFFARNQFFCNSWYHSVEEDSL